MAHWFTPLSFPNEYNLGCESERPIISSTTLATGMRVLTFLRFMRQIFKSGPADLDWIQSQGLLAVKLAQIFALRVICFQLRNADNSTVVPTCCQHSC